MAENTCGTCKFRGKSITKHDCETFEDVNTGYFLCERVKHDQNYEYVKGQGSVVTDGSGYHAALCVEEDFGCIKWESK